MTDFKKPVNNQEFADNFQQIHPIMTENQAHYESSRCLFCYDAPCITACPTGIDIPLFIRQINTGNLTGASKTIYDANWMGNLCGKVCPTEVLCEGACVYNNQALYGGKHTGDHILVHSFLPAVTTDKQAGVFFNYENFLDLGFG